jgi:hypothetical protein
MNKELFLSRLNQVAVLQKIKPKTNPPMSKRVAKPIVEQDTDSDEDQEEPLELFGPDDNPTLGYELVKLKEVLRACDLGCGDSVSGQVVEKRFCTGPEPHWRTRCRTCGYYVSPDGKYFVDGAHAIAAEYVKYFNKLRRQE